MVNYFYVLHISVQNLWVEPLKTKGISSFSDDLTAGAFFFFGAGVVAVSFSSSCSSSLEARSEKLSSAPPSSSSLSSPSSSSSLSSSASSSSSAVLWGCSILCDKVFSSTGAAQKLKLQQFIQNYLNFTKSKTRKIVNKYK